MFGEFLGSLNPGKIELSLQKETLVMSAPGYNGKFQTISADEFPVIPEVTSESEVCRAETLALSQAVERVVFASAKDSLRPVLTGVLWEFGKKSLRLVATDGFRLAVEDVVVDSKKESANLLVPSRAVLEAVRLGGEGSLSIGHLAATNQIYFVTGDVQVVSQLLSGNFPDYNKILPKEFTTEITVNKDELLQAVRATHIFARDNSNMVRWQVEEKQLVLLSSSPERGECRVEVPLKLSGEPIEIIFNAMYVLDYLTIVQGDDLTVGMGTKLSPGMFKDLKRASGQYVVMPINA
jgi:DNA polymerase-3 subunit beta